MKSNSLLFILEPDALTVANTGEPFTRKGVISICSMDLSAKRSDEHRTPQDIYEGESLIESITTKQLDIYQDHINLLIGDVNHEEGISLDYGGRFIWELLQNADDAADAKRTNQQLIGTKGLGFKSVLEISDEPEIYSGDFHFHFSKQKSQKKLKKIPEWLPENGTPIFRLPHNKKSNKNIKALIEKGYSTIIRLPLKTDKKGLVKQRLTELNSTCLLFCQCLNTIEIRTEKPDRQFTIKRPLARHKATAIQLTGDNETTHWRIWREEKKVDQENQISVAICLPLSNKKIVPYEGVPKLHVFFPTEERVEGIQALIHASGELDGNRKHLQTEQPNQQALCVTLKSLMQQILSEIPPDTALLAFGRSNNSGTGFMVDKLWKIIVDTVSETAFIPVIGGNKVKPNEVKLWKHGLGLVLREEKVHDKNLCDPKIMDIEKCQNILRKLKATNVENEEQAELLQQCHNSTPSDCVKAWRVALSLMEKNNECKKHLCEAPFWWTTEGKARAVFGKTPLLWMKAKDFPDWLPVDVVDPRFVRNIRVIEKEHQATDEQWKNPMLGMVDPLRKNSYFDRVLLPYCEGKNSHWWSRHGWKVLKAAFDWQRKDDQPLIIGANNEKERRAKTVYLPVGKMAKEWIPALQCYAGKKWGGPKVFDRYFPEVANRGILPPPGKWRFDLTKENLKKWKEFLSWLGCSWEPKLMRLPALHPDRPYIHHTKRASDYFFEHFDEMVALRTESSFLEQIQRMYSIAKDNGAEYFYRASKFPDSYALIQLRTKEWVTCEPSLLHPSNKITPKKVYMPGCGFDGLFSEVDKGGLDKSDWENTLKTLGAHHHMPDNANEFHDYMDQLGGVTPKNHERLAWNKVHNEKGDIARAANAIFRAYTNLSDPIPRLDGSQIIPCLRLTDHGEHLYFEKAENALWADQPYFAEPEVRREILKQKNLSVFFMFLMDGNDFGLKKLSESLDMEPQYGNKNFDQSHMRERYKQRHQVLILATKQKLLTPNSLTITAHDGITLQSNTHKSIAPEVRFHMESDTDIRVNIGPGHNMWSGLAAALAEIGNCPTFKQGFENFLREDTWEGCVRRLRDDYNQTEEAINALECQKPGPYLSPPTHRSGSGGGGGGHPPVYDVHHDTERQRDSIPPRSPPKIKVENYDFPPLRVGGGTGGSNSGGGGGIAEEHQETGTQGERALYAWLREQYPESKVIDMNEQQPHHPGYDILVQHTNGEQHYYECKTTTAINPRRHVALTRHEHEKAKQAKDRYWLCVVYDINNHSAKMLQPICDPATSCSGEPDGWIVHLDERQHPTH